MLFVRTFKLIFALKTVFLKRVQRMTAVSPCRRTSLINITMTGMVEPLPYQHIYDLYVGKHRQNSHTLVEFCSVLERNGGLWAAVYLEVGGEEAERPLQMERSHSDPGLEDGGGLQAEAQVLLHEPLLLPQGCYCRALCFMTPDSIFICIIVHCTFVSNAWLRYWSLNNAASNNQDVWCEAGGGTDL